MIILRTVLTRNNAADIAIPVIASIFLGSACLTAFPPTGFACSPNAAASGYNTFIDLSVKITGHAIL